MNVEEVVATYRSEVRSLVWPGEILDRLPLLTRRLLISGEGNMVTAFALDERNANDAIREEVAHFVRQGRSFEWKAFSFDEPFDLVERLRTAGFAVEAREAIVVYDLQDGREPFEEPCSCEVRRIERAEDLDDFRQVAEAVFAKDYSPTTDALTEALRTGDRGHEAYVGYLDGTPVSVGRLYTHPLSAFAGLYGGGTLASFRGQGCYRAVVAARAKEAIARGVRYLQVDALPTSRPILSRMGFAHIADTWPCASPPPA